MQSLRGSSSSRARWFVVFAFFLLSTTALPLLTASPAQGSEEPPAEELPAPDFTEIEREERERAEWLLSPEAESQREASHTAYTSLSAGEAQSLLLEVFPKQLKELNADPARFLSELEIEEPLGTYGARISTGEGESALVESAVPVESDLGGEGKEPVDLALEESGEGFVPENPLTEVELPGSAEEPLQTQSGVEVELPASDDHPAEPLGDKNLFYPETDTATDTLVSPIAGGVEIFEQLRSPESPEQFSFALNLPAGASLQMSEEGGGAEVVSSSEEKIEEVPPPSAVDAQGTEVPVMMSVEGDSLVLDIPHKSREVAYPILVDPELLTDSPSFGIPGEWTSSTNGDYTLSNLGYRLAAISKGHVKYGANTHGQWVYAAPGETTYIKQATFSGIYFYINNVKCNNSQPHGYTGLYNVNSQKYIGLGGYAGTNISNFRFETPSVGSQETRDAVLGIGTAEKSIELECAHELYVGGVTVVETDPEAPTINSVSGVPSGWFDPAKAGAATIVATDPGLGLEELTAGDGEVTNTNLQHCSGLSGNRCLRQISWSIHPAYVEGEHTLKVSAEDALAITSHVTNWSTPTKVDTRAPDINLQGQLAVVTKEQGTDKEAAERPQSAGDDELSLPVYNLEVKATDGNEKGSVAERQSGVKNIEVFLDGSKQKVPWEAQACTQAQSSCKMEKTYPLKLVGLSAGEHKLKVIATDQVGLAREREIDFEYIPATGIKDEYITQHFPLPDGEGNESEEEDPKRPELAVNVTNGNLVYRQRDVEVPGTVNLELERFYNSQLPAEDNTEWGEGWTLAQTPKLEPEETKEKAPPHRASMVDKSGALSGVFGVPTESPGTHFDAKLQATVTKEPGGGYVVADQSGRTANSLAFDKTGKVTELLAPGYAKVEYGYENGDLSEVAVHDPASLRAVSPSKKSKKAEKFEAPAYSGTFGGDASGAGHLSTPGGVAIDSEGNVWVADTGHDRIQEFNSKGEFVNQFGTTGKGIGFFREPRGIATDSEGNVWVADTGNWRVQEFDPKGKPIRHFGSPGTGNSQFTSLQGIAIDPEGHVWTVDAVPGGTPRVREFSAEGTYLTKFGVKGTENGQLIEPKGLAVDSKGNVWVADTANNRIEEFNAKGEFIRKSGSAGTGNGQLKSPSGLTADSEGNVWVADTANNRVQEFSATGTYLSQFGTAGNNSGQFSEPRSVATDSKGNVWVADTNNNRVQESTASEFVRKFGGEGSEAGQLSTPNGVATDAKGNVWVADTGHNRIQEFDPSGKALAQFGAKGSADGLFLEPHGLAVDAEGNVWVADTGNYRVEEFNSKGEFVRKFGVKGGANGNFYSVWGVTIDPEGHVWTIDSSQTTSRAQEFNSKGEYIRKFGTYGTTFMNPRGIATDAKGNLWISDSASHRIKEFSAEGKLIRTAGTEGTGDGQFWMPEGIAVDPEGNVWVDDPGNNRVEEFSAEGTYLSQFGTPGNNDGEVAEPRGIATDAKGNLWVADTGNDRVQEYTASEFVRKFGGEGSGAGQFKHPTGTATDSEGNVWVADTGHNRVQEFNSKGEFVNQFGTAAPGDGPLYSPHGIAVDSKDSVWVVDGKGVQEFNAEGEYLGTLLKNGEADHVESLAIDPEGHFWIVKDSGAESYVQELAAEGKVLTKFGSKGTGDGQFENPRGIAIDPKGNVWVADTDNWRVQEFNPKGEFVRKFGSEGTENSPFWYPDALATDSEGHIWVADEGSDRVQEFSATGTNLGQFGTPGNSDGQMSEPEGVTVESEGTLWVADSGNNRLEKWLIPRFALEHSSVYVSSMVGSGSEGGELAHPGDVALGPEGSLWVADRTNNRVEEFDREGEFIEAFGEEVNKTAVEAGGSEAEKSLCAAASGDACQAGKADSAKGALKRPASLAIDTEGDIWVADRGNSRIEEFDMKGKYLSQFGAKGSGKGQFLEPEGLAIDSHGNIWVADTYNGRVQEFSQADELIQVVGSYGAAPGQMGEPTGIDIGPWGHVWVADWQNNRVEEFTDKGKFIRQFGTEGTANGQFERPDGIAIDDRGEVWVTDEGNDRVQAFTEEGEYIAKFGAEGSEEGQFSFGYPIGVATDSNGNLWIADSNNNRVQHWGVYNYVPADEEATVEDTPRVEVNESSGLVASVEGEEAGQLDYEHDGELLTSVDGPKGETAYEYDEAERLTKVTLPNGTWGKVAYDSLGRVKSVTVSIEGGKAKTTHFEYTNESRRTVVEAEGEPTVTYDIGADGSVLKWWDAPSVPTIEEMEGSLYAQRVEVNPEETISPGDQTLVVPAYSIHGISSIQLIANGNQLIKEKTCKQDYEVKDTECVHEELSWVTETENWPPGILQLEVIATDSEGHTSSERFSDNVPYTPPPDPEVPEPPKFAEVLHFREEYGLDLDLKGNERAINERIFQLISDWHDPSTPQGEVARATDEKWGTPLRAVDAAELEYREWFYNLDAERIDQWVEETKPSSFAGYYIDHRAGGIMRIGFLDNQAERLAGLEASLSLVGGERLQVYPVTPTASHLSVQETSQSVSSVIESNATLRELVVNVEEDESGKAVRVGTPNVTQVESILNQMLGSNAPITVEYDAGGGSLLGGRFRNKGRMRAGDAIFIRIYTPPTPEHAGGHVNNKMCTAGFGAKDKAGEVRGQPVWRLFVLSAGHCNHLNDFYEKFVYRSSDSDALKNEDNWKEVGETTRNALVHAETVVATDAEAIRVESDGVVPQGIFGWNGSLIPTEHAGRARIGDTLCFSGAITGAPQCGPIVARATRSFAGEDGHARGGYWVKFNKPAVPGDSGAPVWKPVCRSIPNLSIGLVTAGRPDGSGGSETLVEPLLHPPNLAPKQVVGILNNPHMAPLSLKLGG
jgi:YD repeat-containing protein